jgi:ribonuclease Z
MGIVGEAARTVGNAATAQIAEDVLTYHATPVEAAQSAANAGAGHLLYYHVVPATPIPGLISVFLEGVRDVYAGPVTVGRDGTMISLPARSKQIRVVSE